MVYLLTFTCYGTHLPGDDRGWVDRARGDHRGMHRDANPHVLAHATHMLAEPPYRLNAATAEIVLQAIRGTCAFRRWSLHAAHVRTTHVHAVADGFSDPDRVISHLKAYATRALKTDRKCWARGGSIRALFTTEAVQAAIKYVADKQGEPMAVFVNDPLVTRM